MPTETQARDLLHRTADQLDVGPPPIDALLGAPARRRRKWLVAGAGAAAACFVAAVALIGPGGEGSPAPVPPAQTSDAPHVTPGTQLVSQGEITVAIPDDWKAVTDGCWVEPPALADANVSVADAQCPYFEGSAGLVARQLEPGGVDDWLDQFRGGYDLIPGTNAVRVPTLGIVCLSTTCDMTYRSAIVQDDLGLVLIVSGPNSKIVNTILGSARAAEADDPPPIVSPDSVTITSTSPRCGPTDGPALDVAIETTRRYDALVLLKVGDNVVGKIPTKIRPGKPQHVRRRRLGAPLGPSAVTVQVVGLGMPMATSLLAQLDRPTARALAPVAGSGRLDKRLAHAFDTYSSRYV